MNRSFSDIMFEYHAAEYQFEDALVNCGDIDWERMGGDSYDCSLELYGVNNDGRLNEAAQRLMHQERFAKVFLNHKDGWETHYDFSYPDFKFIENPWRKKQGNCSSILMNYIPERWLESPHTQDMIKSGYYKVVKD